ncbi:MAG: 1-(5-phosphoribosyl)-5-[(5-phosphoribosylamino)methylideneamino]imidazole-4-carboxamide isomerase [Ferruginibacter sp.]
MASVNKSNNIDSLSGPPVPGRTGDRGSGGFIIPAIDIINGKCVRLTHGDFSQQKIYNENPVEVAMHFEDAGLQRLHLVDLDGAKAGQIININVLENIANATKLQVDFGGGIKKEEDVAAVFNAGAQMATIGSLAVKEPLLLAKWIENYGTDKFFIGADVYEEKIKISGWLEDGAVDIFSFLKNMLAIGATQFFCTDIQKDGAMQGASVELYRKIIQQFPGIQLTASGGVTTTNDIDLVKDAGCSGAIIGKALYEQTIVLSELSKY